jgi:hypothetical protein
MNSTADTTRQRSIFDAGDNRALVERLRALSPQSKALWGKLQVAQMLAHCHQPLRVACGDLKLERGLIGILFGKMAKKKLLSGKPFGRNMPTHPKFVITDQREFEREREQVIRLVERFAKAGPALLSSKPHPFFGPLSVEEWDRLQWLHLDHHLVQFGV